MAGIFTESVCSLLNTVPPGFVVTYGGLAAAAGFPRAARQVVRILHTQSRMRNLPWHRVVAAGGRIALKDPMAADLQKELLCSEGVQMINDGWVDMKKHYWDFSGTVPD
ncbi:MAG: MGMT family protein [Spirochaetaceae bacterium]|nr:MGMT family protein [Spirochaetaceae bacterium]RKX89121.1 MAG: DNA methyltransferase [Spirochaetota bacterium]